MRFWKFIKDEIVDLPELPSDSSEQHDKDQERQGDGQPQDGQEQQNGEQSKDEQDQQNDGTPQDEQEQQNDGQSQDSQEQQNGEQPQDKQEQQNDGQSKGEQEQQSDGQSKGEQEQQGDGQSQDSQEQQNGEQPQDEQEQQNDGQSKDEQDQQNDGQSQDKQDQQNGEQSKDEQDQQNDGTPQDKQEQQNDGQSQDKQEQQNGEQSKDEQDQQNGEQSKDEQDQQNGEQSKDEQNQQNGEQSKDEQDQQNGEQSKDEQEQQNDGQSKDEQDQQNGEQSKDEQDQQNGEQPQDKQDQQNGELSKDEQEQQNDGTSQDNQNDEQYSYDSSLNTDSLENKKNQLQRLRDVLKQIAEQKEKQDQYSELSNQFLDELQELPPFEERMHNDGYSIHIDDSTEIPDSLIRTLIQKFLNQRFRSKSSDLNIRANNNLEKTRGFYKWNVKDVIVHYNTHQANKVLLDKYSYEYSNGKNEKVPLSFYFDMSGSMNKYTGILSVIAIELLKQNVKVLIGYNQTVNVQIDSIHPSVDVHTLSSFLNSAGYYFDYEKDSFRSSFEKSEQFHYQFVNSFINYYLIKHHAEKCVVFSDFDPKAEICALSQKADVYWFCFEQRFVESSISEFQGFFYPVQNAEDIMNGLIKVNERRFEALRYIDNPKTLQRRK